MSVVVRFAPSPTGFLHIGGARTALFNWLFARHHGGRFLLRIEDTDRARSTPEAVAAIVDGLSWLGLDWDGETVMQSARSAIHAAAARRLLAEGRAYHCWCTPQELDAMREKARAEGRSVRYDGTWRDRDPSEAPPGVPPVIRRADGSPTYNLSVVVDDHDMAITHVIRGDDHLTNAFRQTQIYRALGWHVPDFAHVPLIHGTDGAKLSKRHGALGVDAYRDLGYLPEGLRNYLLRLGWSHGDDEIIPTEKAVAWFDIDSIGRAPARFDFAKLASVNGYYLREVDDAALAELAAPRLESLLGHPLDRAERRRLALAMPDLKPRAKTLVELAEVGRFYVERRPIPLDEKARALLGLDARARLGELAPLLAATDWTMPSLEETVRRFAAAKGLKLGAVAQPLRAALAGAITSPGIFEVILVLGRDETLGRLGDAAANPPDSGEI
jgi:glutamyl-tRNA synthetase